MLVEQVTFQPPTSKVQFPASNFEERAWFDIFVGKWA